jgi:hypothetical protein
MYPGQTILKDPDAKLVYEFDWTSFLDGANVATSTFTIAGDDAILTKDNAAIVSGAKKTSVRLLGGTLGKRYLVTNHIITDETPAQEDDRSIYVRIAQK